MSLRCVIVSCCLSCDCFRHNNVYDKFFNFWLVVMYWNVSMYVDIWTVVLCDVRLEKEIHDIRCKKEEEEAERIERYSSVLVFMWIWTKLLLLIPQLFFLGLKVALESGELRHDMTTTQRCRLLRHLTLEHSTDFTKLKDEVEFPIPGIASFSISIHFFLSVHSLPYWRLLYKKCRAITANGL